MISWFSDDDMPTQIRLKRSLNEDLPIAYHNMFGMLLEYAVDMLELVPAEGDWAKTEVWSTLSKEGAKEMRKFFYALEKPLCGQDLKGKTKIRFHTALIVLVKDIILVKVEYPHSYDDESDDA